jgi:hypothetical protein
MTALLKRPAAHPNEFDKRRIERALDQRVRYRYVAPRVLETERGYKVESPCCSRNIASDGGVIDIALLEFDERQKLWCLSAKDHIRNEWRLTSVFVKLHEALAMLTEDAQRDFWQ